MDEEILKQLVLDYVKTSHPIDFREVYEECIHRYNDDLLKGK